MSEQATTRRVIEPQWYLAPEFQQGALSLAGLSRLGPTERNLLEELATSVTRGQLELPPTPQTALEAVEALRAAEVDFSLVAGRIGRDSVLAAPLKRPNVGAVLQQRQVWRVMGCWPRRVLNQGHQAASLQRAASCARMQTTPQCAQPCH
ncbi:MAG: hypothetical protein EXS14_04850 [Planctomycetes bacterium]|nr:hypothetical protein [Planctomycetota bacterium]